jgi:ElaB/YqjD/DUF883 family membrane-anchored ribosome-binding protein
MKNILAKPEVQNTEEDSTTELREQVRVLADDVKKLGSMAKHSAAEQLDAVRRQAGHAVEVARTKTRNLEENTARAISARPFTSVLISAGAGAVAACLVVLLARRGSSA